jgi:hypothetical protein
VKAISLFSTIVLSVQLASAQGPTAVQEVAQPNINGSATGAELGSPLGQSFTSQSSSPLTGLFLASVDTASAADLSFQLWRTDAAGAALVGSPLASASITASQIALFAPTTGVGTPIYFPVTFDQPYAQTQGERLAFTISGGDAMKFYFGNGSGYRGGQLLGDPSRDLTFATIVPEPSTWILSALGLTLFVIIRHHRVSGQCCLNH